MAEEFTAYMTKNLDMFGLTVPIYAVWVLGTLLLLAAVILGVHFYRMHRSEVSAQPAAQPPVPKYWRKGTLPVSSGLLAARELSDTERWLDMQICYNGRVQNVRCRFAPDITIGRQNCNVLLDAHDTAISAQHCTLYYRGAVLMLRDHSTNGTRVNGHLVHRSQCRVNPGDCITVSAHQIYI